MRSAFRRMLYTNFGKLLKHKLVNYISIISTHKFLQATKCANNKNKHKFVQKVANVLYGIILAFLCSFLFLTCRSWSGPILACVGLSGPVRA